jgi:tRNA 2-thiouridine synthesizing protein A
MSVFDFFRRKPEADANKRHLIQSNIEQVVELPGYGEVEVSCRIDCEGESCPRPQLLTLKALNDCEEGAVVEVVTDNLSAVETIPSMMDVYEGRHLATLREGNLWRIYVRRELYVSSDR